MSESVKKTYEALKGKYQLPAFDAVNHEFEISSFESDVFLLREIRRRITEKIEFFGSVLESLLQPDTASVAHMHEYRVLDDAKRKTLSSLYKDLMVLYRTAMIAECRLDEKEDASFIKSIMEKWPNLRKEMEKVFIQLKGSWITDDDVVDKLEYLG